MWRGMVYACKNTVMTPAARGPNTTTCMMFAVRTDEKRQHHAICSKQLETLNQA